MRFLADESCDFGVVLALRTAGHDVVAIAEVSPREEDDSVMERALQEERIVVTEDKVRSGVRPFNLDNLVSCGVKWVRISSCNLIGERF